MAHRRDEFWRGRPEGRRRARSGGRRWRGSSRRRADDDGSLQNMNGGVDFVPWRNRGSAGEQWGRRVLRRVFCNMFLRRKMIGRW
jgi:hypothetical protein